MREVTPETAANYLRETGRVPSGRAVNVRALGWGVSNVVMRADIAGEPPIVLKQARERLRTRALWVSRLERIWTERAALDLLAEILPPGTVPKVVFADPENYLFAMTCAPDDSTVWKERLLAGETDLAVADQAGEILGMIHAGTIGHPALESNLLADTAVFDELRIEPFYRAITRVHPDVAPQVEALIASMAAGPRRCFVHADFSPKNILVHGRGLTLVDFETAHAGDPAFDLGFFLSHLVLKAIRAAPEGIDPYLSLTHTFWQAYLDHGGEALADPGLVRRANAHASACALARIDGTSPVDYLDERGKGIARRFALRSLRSGPVTWDDLLGIVAREVRNS
jgi:5-methylthioribose kinase